MVIRGAFSLIYKDFHVISSYGSGLFQFYAITAAKGDANTTAVTFFLVYFHAAAKRFVFVLYP